MSSVWVQLYYKDIKKGQPTSVRKPTEVKESDWNIDTLVDAVKDKLSPDIDHASRVFVYPPDTKPPFLQDKAIDPGDDVPPGTTSKNPLIVVAPAQKQQQPPSEPTQYEPTLVEMMNNIGIALHEIKEAMPSVVVGHVITPSVASQSREVSSQLITSLNLALLPPELPDMYGLPDNMKDEGNWTFNWKWDGDNPLESTSYGPVCNFLQRLGLIAEDVSGGQKCVNRRLYNSEIYSLRQNDPSTLKGQKVYLLHRVQGRTDIAVLAQNRNGGQIMKHMVSFAIEIKTTKALANSHDGCMLEAQLQLIGLNAFNTVRSPPVVLTNLARTHKVLYIEYKEGTEWGYIIKSQKCQTFPAAIHLAMKRAAMEGISAEFSRPMTPPSE